MLECENCEQIKGQVDNRLNNYGYNEIKDDPHNVGEIMREIYGFCYCDKVGSKLIYVENCENYPMPSENISKSKKQRLDRRTRNEKYNNKLKRRAELGQGCYEEHTVFDREFGYSYIEKGYVRKYSVSRSRKHARKYYKKAANRAVRRYKGTFQGDSDYKKIFDYRWMTM